MGNKNYTKYSDNSNNNNVITPETPVTPETPEVITEPEVTTEPVTQNDSENNDDHSGTNIIAVVTNCTKLNVRKEAKKDAEVVCVINKGTELALDLDTSTEDFYKVSTSNGVEGYCVKDFIEIK